MNSPGIRRYERELRRAVHGFRRRKRILEAFRCSLMPLLEDMEAPTYKDLELAFGPPEQMAQELMEGTPNLPNPMQLKQKVWIAVAVCLIVAMVCGGNFYWKNMPEAVVEISDGQEYEEKDLYSDYEFQFTKAFTQQDISWTQDKKYSEYLLLFENTNETDTMIGIEYSDYQEPHILIIHPGEKRAIKIENARPTEHTVSFDSANGSVSGNVQLFFRLPS